MQKAFAEYAAEVQDTNGIEKGISKIKLHIIYSLYLIMFINSLFVTEVDELQWLKVEPILRHLKLTPIVAIVN